MTLLKFDDLKTRTVPAGFCEELRGGVEHVHVLGERAQMVKETIGTVRIGTVKHFVTAAQWGMHHLLEYLLSVTGKANIYMTLYSISEDPARMLQTMKSDGRISYLAGLVDWHVRRDKSRSWQTMEKSFDTVGYQNVHAKVIAIESRDLKLCIVASCNFNKNKRYEAGVITASEQSCSFHRDWILNEIRKCNSQRSN